MSCNDDGSCTACNDLENRNPDTCDCKTGFYNDDVSITCKECKPECETCGDFLSCSTCKGNKELMTSGPLCGCPMGEVDPPGIWCTNC